MSFYEPAHLSVANNLSSSLLWKVRERFGDYADQLLDNAQQSVRLLCEPTGLTLDGWVQDAGRSVVASAQDGNVIIKSPLVDGLNTILAIAGYSQAGSGPEAYALSFGPSSPEAVQQCAIAMQRVDGRYLHVSERPTFDEIAQIVGLAGTVDLTQLPLLPKFITLTDRLETECVEALRRANILGDTSAVDELSVLASKINQTDRPTRICHGDLDMRNVLHQDGQIMVIDPEPLIAPKEFDAAKITFSAGLCPAEVAEHLDLDVKLTVDLHRFFTIAGLLYSRVKGRAMS